MPPVEALGIRTFRRLMHDVIDMHLTADAFENFAALAACYPEVDRARLLALVAAAETVFLDVVRYYAPPIPGGDHRGEGWTRGQSSDSSVGEP